MKYYPCEVIVCDGIIDELSDLEPGDFVVARQHVQGVLDQNWGVYTKLVLTV